MTSQTKTFIELSDIVGLKLDCKIVGIWVLINEANLVTFRTEQYIGSPGCPTCNSSWTQTEIYTAPVRNELDLTQKLRK